MRLLEPDDLPRAASVSAAAFGIDISTGPARERWLDRVGHSLRTDPGGCFVAERHGRVVGVAQAIVREGLWILSLLTVDPGGQSAGAGRALMRAVLGYGPAGAPGLIVSSNDARALRLYGSSGFSLRPTLQAEGMLNRRALPVAAARVSEDSEPDLEALADVSRAIRGAPHTLELELALRRGGRLVHCGDRGFAVAQPGQGVWLLVARDDDTATTLLWSALGVVGDAEPCAVRWIQGPQDWAIDVLLRAGLKLSGYGAICTRGAVGPLRPYIPSAPFA